MNIILATNFKEFNNYIQQNVPQLNVIVHDIETQSEALEEITQTQSIDAIMLTDLLRGERGLVEYLELVMQLKEENTKVFYIAKSYGEELLKAFAKYNIQYYKPESQSLEDFIEIVIEDKLQGTSKVIIKEKIIRKETIIEKEIPIGFKKLVLAVWGNPEFACELAYVMAKNTNHNVLLIDADLLAPTTDLYLNIKKYPEGITSQGLFTDSGLNIVLDAIEKNAFTPQLLQKASVGRKDVKNLSVLTGNYKMENYEYYSSKAFEKLIEHAYENFEITILLLNKSIYDEFTFIGLKRADYNIMPVRADFAALRESNNYLVFLRDKQLIPLGKSKFVAWEYIKGISMDEKILQEITDGHYIGSISYSPKRIKYRAMKAAFVGHIGEQKNQYLNILAQFKIVPKRRFIDVLKARIKSVLKLKRREVYARSKDTPKKRK